MIAMFMMTMMAGYVFDLSSHDLRTVKNLDRSMQAQYLAEAGLNEALSVLAADFNDWNDPTEFPATAMGAGTYDAEVTQVGGRYLVSCVGDVMGTQRTATAEVSPPPTSALAYILAGGSNLNLQMQAVSWCQIRGDVYATQDINLSANAILSWVTLSNPGDAYAGGAINDLGGNVIYNNLFPNSASAVEFPVFDFAQYQAIAQANGQYINGSINYSVANSIPANPPGGVIFVNGDLTISRSQNTTACLIATGNINITRGLVRVQQFQTYPAMMTVNGNITITTGFFQSALWADGLVYSGNNFSIVGAGSYADIAGSIITRGTLSESGTVCWLRMFYAQQNPPFMTSNGGTLDILSYNS